MQEIERKANGIDLIDGKYNNNEQLRFNWRSFMRICQECRSEVKEGEKVCPKCGSENIKEEKFCRILGTKL